MNNKNKAKNSAHYTPDSNQAVPNRAHTEMKNPENKTNNSNVNPDNCRCKANNKSNNQAK